MNLNDLGNQKSFDLAKELLWNQEKQIESLILGQLKEFIDRNLLVIERSDPIIVEDNKGNLEVKTFLKFHLKDQDYIRQLEAENKELRERIESIEKAFLRRGGPRNPGTYFGEKTLDRMFVRKAIDGEEHNIESMKNILWDLFSESEKKRNGENIVKEISNTI
jgi:hypothetical protein